MRIIAAIFLSIVLFANNGFAAGSLIKDNSVRSPIQGAAWNGAKSQALTIASTIVDFSSDLAAKVYTATDCWERWMPLSTSTKASYVKTPILAGTWETTVINPATPFGNFSGCTGGYIKRH